MPKRKRDSAKQRQAAARTHFLRRLQQRYDVFITREEYEALLQTVRRGYHIFLDRQSHTRTIMAFSIDGKLITAAYHRGIGMLVTALPTESAYHQAATQLVESNTELLNALVTKPAQTNLPTHQPTNPPT